MTHRQRERLKALFLAHFAEYGNVTMACREVGIDRTVVYKWQEHDDEFAAAFRQAELVSTEVLEAEARRRAVDGVTTETPVYVKGELVNTIVETKYSDTLLIFLLKARAPEKYRERFETTLLGANGQPPRLEVVYTDAPALPAATAPDTDRNQA